MNKWEMVRLGDVGTVLTGNTPKTDNPNNYSSNDLCFYKPSDFCESKITILEDAENHISNYAREKARIVPPQSVLVTCIGIIGKVGITTREASLNQQINAIIPNDNVCPSGYMAYAVLHINKQLNHIANAAVVPIINKSQFSNIQIPLPPLPIQQKIADILDRANALIEKRKAQIEKLDLLIKSQFIQMFGDPVTNPMGWDVKPLSDVILHANNGMARRGNDAKGNIVLRLVELQDGYIDYTKPNRIQLDDTEKKRYLLVDGDLLFARVNGNPEYVGRCAVYFNVNEAVYHNDHIIRVRFDNQRMNGTYASELLNSSYGKREMKDKIKTSAGQYTINQSGIGAIIAPLPPLPLQTQFAAFVERVEAQKAQMKKGLELMELAYKSLMQKCFNGEMFC